MPPEIAKLTNLTNLEIYNNKFTRLPPEVPKLTKLTLLNLGGNEIASLPSEILKLTNLTSLYLWGNKLTEVPLLICKMKQLIELTLTSNNLTTVPPEIGELTHLTYLDLRRNQIKSLPQEILKLGNLSRLELSHNQLPIPPETLANPEDVKTIFAALAGLVSGERLNEAKMLVVGDGKVGKSSVVEQLIYGTFNPRKQTTLGVEIDDEMQVVESEVKGAGQQIKLNIWDFGGQEIQHSTHQFLLDHSQPLPAGGGRA